MDHGYFRDRLSAYLDQELTPEETKAIADHLEECADCREQLAKLGELERLVQEHSGLDGDDYFEKAAQKIEQRLGATHTAVTDIFAGSAGRFKGLWWKVTSVAASAAILVFIGLHQDDIFGPGDLALPTDTPGEERQQQMAPAADTAALTDDMDEGKAAISTAAEGLQMDESTSPSGDVGYLEEVTAKKEEEAPGIPEPVQAPVRAPVLPSETDLRQEPESSKPPPLPPPAPPGRTLRESATSALRDQMVSGAETDDNYRRPVVDQSVGPDMNKSFKVDAESDEEIVMEIAEQDYAPGRGLPYWSQRRDSLTELAASSARRRKSMAAFRAEEVNSLVPTAKSKVSGQSVDKVEADLLEAWFWIGKLSADSSETAAARAELEQRAGDSTSVNRDLAADYLRRLGNK